MDSEKLNYLGISVHAGFPNAADDTRLKALDLNTLLIKQPNSTYHFRVAGNQWWNVGIFHGDIALVDRALPPRPNDLVIWWHENEFAVSPLHKVPKQADIWGVVTTTIHQLVGTHD